MKKILKSKKGITLVALVITVIILLILAGISIATLTGSGLFEKARLAEQESKNKQKEEQGILRDYENKIGEYVGSNRNNSYKAKSLINKNDTLYSATDKGFVFDTPTTYTDLSSRNYFINLTDSISNYDYIVFNYDVCYSNTFNWGNIKTISTQFSNGFLKVEMNSTENWITVAFNFVDDNKIKIAAAHSSTSKLSKIRIVDIKGIKL